MTDGFCERQSRGRANRLLGKAQEAPKVLQNSVLTASRVCQVAIHGIPIPEQSCVCVCYHHRRRRRRRCWNGRDKMIVVSSMETGSSIQSRDRSLDGEEGSM